VLVDLIFAPKGLAVDDELIERAEVLSVLSIELPVMSLEDLLATKLMALTEHSLDFAGPLRIARALREQIDWDQIRERTRSSPFAVAFFVMLEQLEIVSGPAARAA
jgi:predicted nucleotidyltransferase